jgi:hypothetical protein
MSLLSQTHSLPRIRHTFSVSITIFIIAPSSTPPFLCSCSLPLFLINKFSLELPSVFPANSVLLPNTQYRLFGIVGKPRQDPNLHRSIRMLEITLFESASRSIVRYYWYYPGKLETAVLLYVFLT